MVRSSTGTKDVQLSALEMGVLVELRPAAVLRNPLGADLAGHDQHGWQGAGFASKTGATGHGVGGVGGGSIGELSFRRRHQPGQQDSRRDPRSRTLPSPHANLLFPWRWLCRSENQHQYPDDHQQTDQKDDADRAAEEPEYTAHGRTSLSPNNSDAYRVRPALVRIVTHPLAKSSAWAECPDLHSGL
jgi:hypothetical protein